MTAIRSPQRIVVSDGKGRPGWADEVTWALYETINAKAADLGFTSMACGWAMQPKAHGEYRLGRGPLDFIVVGATTPADAVKAMSRLVLTAGESRTPVPHSYLHPDPTDCYSYAECHRKAYGS